MTSGSRLSKPRVWGSSLPLSQSFHITDDDLWRSHLAFLSKDHLGLDHQNDTKLWVQVHAMRVGKLVFRNECMGESTPRTHRPSPSA